MQKMLSFVHILLTILYIFLLSINSKMVRCLCAFMHQAYSIQTVRISYMLST